MDMAKTKLAQLAQHGDLLERYGASVRILGQRSLLKEDVLEAMDNAVEMTKGHGDAILNVCFPYTSQDEMTTAIRDTVAEYSKPLPIPQESSIHRRRSFSESHIVNNIQATRRLSTSSPSPPDLPSGAPSPPVLKVTRSQSPNSSTAASDTEDSVSSSATTLYPDSPNPYPDFTAVNPLKADSLLRPHSQEQDQHQNIQQYPDPESITATTLNAHMFTTSLPPLDLLIRTSGVERLSDFMLWQCHEKTDIVFLKCLWPDFDLWSFLPVLVEWQWRRRKEGVSRLEAAEGISSAADKEESVKVKAA